jgi:hypothetical protein
MMYSHSGHGLKVYEYRAVWILIGSNIGLVIKSRRMRWVGYVARMRERSGVYRVLVGKPEGKRPLVRPSHKWEDNIKMDLKEVVWAGMDWSDLTRDRDRWRALVTAVMILRVP